jgi:hypothetical protein
MQVQARREAGVSLTMETDVIVGPTPVIVSGPSTGSSYEQNLGTLVRAARPHDKSVLVFSLNTALINNSTNHHVKPRRLVIWYAPTMSFWPSATLLVKILGRLMKAPRQNLYLVDTLRTEAVMNYFDGVLLRCRTGMEYHFITGRVGHMICVAPNFQVICIPHRTLVEVRHGGIESLPTRNVHRS